MTANTTTRIGNGSGRISLAPAALAGLLGAALLAGGAIGALGAEAATMLGAHPLTATVGSFETGTRRAAQVAVGRGPLAGDTGSASVAASTGATIVTLATTSASVAQVAIGRGPLAGDAVIGDDAATIGSRVPVRDGFGDFEGAPSVTSNVAVQAVRDGIGGFQDRGPTAAATPARTLRGALER